jgi:hypothetical protein
MAVLHNTFHSLPLLSTTLFTHSSTSWPLLNKYVPIQFIFHKQFRKKKAAATSFSLPPVTSQLLFRPLLFRLRTKFTLYHPPTYPPYPHTPSRAVPRIFNIRHFRVVMTILFSLRLMIGTLSLSLSLSSNSMLKTSRASNVLLSTWVRLGIRMAVK